MILSIIIPVYNEENTIIEVLNKIKDNLENKFEYEIIVIDDGSTDQSRKLLENNKTLYNKLLINEFNKGKGFSVKKGLLNCSGTHVAFQDGDLEYNPEDLLSMLNLIKKEDNIDSIYGSRYLDKKLANKQKVVYYIANKINLLLFNIFFQSKLTDLHSCYKLFKTEIIKNFLFTEKKFGFELEVTTLLIKNHFIIKEIPIKYQARDKSLGKKINFMDEISFLISIFKFRFFS